MPARNPKTPPAEPVARPQLVELAAVSGAAAERLDAMQARLDAMTATLEEIRNLVMAAVAAEE